MLWAWWLHLFPFWACFFLLLSCVLSLGRPLDFSRFILSLSDHRPLSDKINLEKSKGGLEQKQNPFWKKLFYVLGSILSQSVPVPGRDKIILKKLKAHNNKKEKHRNQRNNRAQPTEKQTETEQQDKQKKQKHKFQINVVTECTE